MQQLAWSVMSGKMVGIPALNTDTTSNKFCMSQAKDTNSICSSCYSWSMLQTFRKNAVPRFRKNSEIISKSLLNDNELPRPKGNTARFNGHGEIINTYHIQNIVKFALFYPKVTFTLWTKKKSLIQSFFRKNDKPSNLLLVFSNPTVGVVYKDVPKYFDKVFNVVEQDGDNVNCHGKCIDCMKCYDVNDNTKQIVEIIK